LLVSSVFCPQAVLYGLPSVYDTKANEIVEILIRHSLNIKVNSNAFWNIFERSN
jgi:hypothetical protein